MQSSLTRYGTASLLILVAASAAWSNATSFVTPSLPPVLEAVAGPLQLDEQDAAVRAIKKVSPAVVSIIVSEDQTVVRLGSGAPAVSKEKKQIGTGTGFLISKDGYILTNRHVVNVQDRNAAQYQVILNSGKKYYAQFIGNDPLKDLAVLKIFDKNLPFIEMGDSATLEQGMTVMAIGNSLGKYQNTVTKGIVSALGRSLQASDGRGTTEALDNVIQTDAGINPGNSGGPLINLEGTVVGINTAIDQSGSSIGFAIPINDAKVIIRSIKEENRIVRPRVGIQYRMLTPELAEEFKLPRSKGAWISRGEDGQAAILPGSPAEKAGLQENDIIFEINTIPVEGRNTLFDIVQRYKPGQKIGFKIQRGKDILIKTVTLDEFKQ